MTFRRPSPVQEPSTEVEDVGVDFQRLTGGTGAETRRLPTTHVWYRSRDTTSDINVVKQIGRVVGTLHLL